MQGNLPPCLYLRLAEWRTAHVGSVGKGIFFAWLGTIKMNYQGFLYSDGQ